MKNLKRREREKEENSEDARHTNMRLVGFESEGCGYSGFQFSRGGIGFWSVDFLGLFGGDEDGFSTFEAILYDLEVNLFDVVNFNFLAGVVAQE